MYPPIGAALMANELEVFRFGKLIALVKRIGHQNLFRVQLVGGDDELVTHLYSRNHLEAAKQIISELAFANENKDAFYVRRRAWIRKLAEDPAERKREWAHVHELFEYAKRNILNLWAATQTEPLLLVGQED